MQAESFVIINRIDFFEHSASVSGVLFDDRQRIHFNGLKMPLRMSAMNGISSMYFFYVSIINVTFFRKEQISIIETKKEKKTAEHIFDIVQLN